MPTTDVLCKMWIGHERRSAPQSWTLSCSILSSSLQSWNISQCNRACLIYFWFVDVLRVARCIISEWGNWGENPFRFLYNNGTFYPYQVYEMKLVTWIGIVEERTENSRVGSLAFGLQLRSRDYSSLRKHFSLSLPCPDSSHSSNTVLVSFGCRTASIASLSLDRKPYTGTGLCSLAADESNHSVHYSQIIAFNILDWILVCSPWIGFNLLHMVFTKSNLVHKCNIHLRSIYCCSNRQSRNLSTTHLL